MENSAPILEQFAPVEQEFQFYVSLIDQFVGAVGVHAVLTEGSKSETAEVYHYAPKYGTLVSVERSAERCFKDNDFIMACAVSGLIKLRTLDDIPILNGCVEVSVSFYDRHEDDFTFVIGKDEYRLASGYEDDESFNNAKMDVAKMHAVRRIMGYVKARHHTQIALSSVVLEMEKHLAEYNAPPFDSNTITQLFQLLPPLLGGVLDNGIVGVNGVVAEIPHDMWKRHDKIHNWVAPSTTETAVARSVALKYRIDLMYIGDLLDSGRGKRLHTPPVRIERFGGMLDTGSLEVYALLNAFSENSDPYKYFPRNYTKWFRRKVEKEFAAAEGYWESLRLYDLYKTLWCIRHDKCGSDIKCPAYFSESIRRFAYEFPGMLSFTYNGFSQVTRLMADIIWHLMDFGNDPIINGRMTNLYAILLGAVYGDNLSHAITSLQEVASGVTIVVKEKGSWSPPLIEYIQIEFDLSEFDARNTFLDVISGLKGGSVPTKSKTDELLTFWDNGKTATIKLHPTFSLPHLSPKHISLPHKKGYDVFFLLTDITQTY